MSVGALPEGSEEDRARFVCVPEGEGWLEVLRSFTEEYQTTAAEPGFILKHNNFVKDARSTDYWHIKATFPCFGGSLNM